MIGDTELAMRVVNLAVWRWYRMKKRTRTKKASNGERPETGPMKFGDDWPGVFIRGDNAAHHAHALDEVLAWIEKLGESSTLAELEEAAGNQPLIMLEVLKGLSDTLKAPDVRLKTTAQVCKPFEECLVSDWGAKLTEDGLEMVIAGTCPCGRHHETREYPGDLDYDQSYVFACSCGRNVTITSEQLSDALASGGKE